MKMNEAFLNEKALRECAREIHTLCKRKKSTFFLIRKGVKYQKNHLVNILGYTHIYYPTINLHLNNDNTVKCEISYDNKNIESFIIEKHNDNEIYLMLAECYDKIEERYIQMLERLNIA